MVQRIRILKKYLYISETISGDFKIADDDAMSG
jgi:hypothetical protein